MWTHPRYRELTGREPPGLVAARAAVPAPSGEPLAAFPRKGPRGGELELRVSLDRFEGHDYIAVRVWQRDRDGAWWPVKGRGCSIRLSEAEGVAQALLAALDRVDGHPVETRGRDR